SSPPRGARRALRGRLAGHALTATAGAARLRKLPNLVWDALDRTSPDPERLATPAASVRSRCLSSAAERSGPDLQRALPGLFAALKWGAALPAAGVCSAVQLRAQQEERSRAE